MRLVTSASNNADAERLFWSRKTITWPNDCHDCGTRMQFSDSDAPMHRVCPACGATAKMCGGALILSGQPQPSEA